MQRIAGAGAVLGFLGAVGIYFDPGEPYPGYITLAGTLSGITIAVLISAVVTRDSSLGRCVAWGACMGLLDSAAVFLAKGAWASGDAPFVVPTGIVTGMILGPVVRWLRRKAT
ncbi:MAG TPA: hypothetical protein VLD67_02260 [Vicinamibacterales bacterium]|nr:hypothetical protein [Vicinamibacterales bacterium]